MFKPYETNTFYDEMLEGDKPKKHYIPFYQQLQRFTENQLLEKHNEAQSSFFATRYHIYSVRRRGRYGAYNAV